MKFTCSAVGDRFLVQNEAETQVFAIFSWIDASHAKPAAGKHLDLRVVPDAYILDDGSWDARTMMAVLRFVFEKVVEFTHNLSPAHVCKIYCNDEIVKFAYISFAEHLESKGEYTVKLYGQWIEVWRINK